MKITHFYLFIIVNLSLAKGICQVVEFEEPEFVGDILLINDNHTILLEKQKSYGLTDTDIKDIVTNIVLRDNIVSTKLIIDGEKSSIRISKGKDLKFIVRVENNNYSPLDKIDIYKFKVAYHKRKVETIKVNSTAATTKGFLSYMVKFKGVKYGTSSYLITIPTIRQGEYGITINGETYNLFAVDYYFKVGDKVEWEEYLDNILRNEKTIFHYGEVIETGDNEIKVQFKNEDGTIFIKNLDTKKEEIRLLDESNYTEKAKHSIQLGQIVKWKSTLAGEWFGEVIKVDSKSITVNTGDKGKEFIRDMDVNSVEIVELPTLNTDEYKPETIFGKINVGDKIKMENNSEKFDIWVGTYLGVKNGNIIGIKTTLKGKHIIKNIKIEDFIINKI